MSWTGSSSGESARIVPSRFGIVLSRGVIVFGAGAR